MITLFIMIQVGLVLVFIGGYCFAMAKVTSNIGSVLKASSDRKENEDWWKGVLWLSDEVQKILDPRNHNPFRRKQ